MATVTYPQLKFLYMGTNTRQQEGKLALLAAQYQKEGYTTAIETTNDKLALWVLKEAR